MIAVQNRREQSGKGQISYLISEPPNNILNESASNYFKYIKPISLSKCTEPSFHLFRLHFNAYFYNVRRKTQQDE